VEQEYGEPNSATSLAARTVLPGEPFDPPASAAVPGPRDLPPAQLEQAPEVPPQWNFGPPAQSELAMPPRSFEPASYDPTYGDPNTADPHHPVSPDYGQSYAPTYATAESLTAPEQIEGLHQFALPMTEGADPALQFAAPQAAPAYPPAYDTSAPPAYPASDVTAAYPPPAAPPAGMPAYPAPTAPSSWPAPMPEPTASHQAFAGAPDQALLAPPADEPPTGEDAEGTHRKSHRGPNRSLVILAAVVVLGGAGYFGYTQLSKSDSNSGSSVVPPRAKTPASTAPVVTPNGTPVYAYPSQLAGFSQRTGADALTLVHQISSFSKSAYPAFMGTPQIASYGTPGTVSVIAVTFHPVVSKLAAGFKTILTGVQKPATGNTVGAFTAVPTGAAGGSMTCGSQSGVSPISYCVWKGKSAIGMVYIKGTTATPNTQALTREMRAGAEH
jgi:hypothetical protein